MYFCIKIYLTTLFTTNKLKDLYIKHNLNKAFYTFLLNLIFFDESINEIHYYSC